MALRSGRTGVRRDQVDHYGRVRRSGTGGATIEDFVDSETIVFSEDSYSGLVKADLDGDTLNKIEKSLQTPTTTPTATELVGIGTDKSQKRIDVGDGLEIENNVLKATGGGGSGIPVLTIEASQVDPDDYSITFTSAQKEIIENKDNAVIVIKFNIPNIDNRVLIRNSENYFYSIERVEDGYEQAIYDYIYNEEDGVLTLEDNDYPLIARGIMNYLSEVEIGVPYEVREDFLDYATIFSAIQFDIKDVDNSMYTMYLDHIDNSGAAYYYCRDYVGVYNRSTDTVTINAITE